MIKKPNKKENFADLVSGVKRLDSDRINTYHDRVIKTLKTSSLPRESGPDFSNLKFEELSQYQELHFNSGITKKLQRKIRQGSLPIEDRVDLHGCTQEQATTELNLFLDYALSSGFRLLIIIHGKGQRSEGGAVLKPLVQNWLAQQASVLAWCPAQANHGGSGATYMYLRAG